MTRTKTDIKHLEPSKEKPTICPDYDDDCKDMTVAHATWCFIGCPNHQCNPGVNIGTAKGYCPIIQTNN